MPGLFSQTKCSLLIIRPEDSSLKRDGTKPLLETCLPTSLTVDGRHTLCQGRVGGLAGTSFLEQVV